MIGIYNGVRWYCCPRCGKRLFIVKSGATCHGIYMRCRGSLPSGVRCRWSGEVVIEEDMVNGKCKEEPDKKGDGI